MSQARSPSSLHLLALHQDPVTHPDPRAPSGGVDLDCERCTHEEHKGALDDLETAFHTAEIRERREALAPLAAELHAKLEAELAPHRDTLTMIANDPNRRSCGDQLALKLHAILDGHLKRLETASRPDIPSSDASTLNNE